MLKGVATYNNAQAVLLGFGMDVDIVTLWAFEFEGGVFVGELVGVMSR